MGGKQIGDVLLSTANNNITAVDGFFINMHDDAGQYKVNIFFTGKKTDTDKALEVAYKKNGLFFYLGYGIKSLDELKKIELDILKMYRGGTVRTGCGRCW